MITGAYCGNDECCNTNIHTHEELIPAQKYITKAREKKLEDNIVQVHQCAICNKVFATMRGLHQHSVIHTNIKPFECHICGRTFRYKSNWSEHRSVHTGSTLVYCPFCNKSFRLKGNLKKHLRTHVGSDREVDEAYLPFASKRRKPLPIPENAVVIKTDLTPLLNNLKKSKPTIVKSADPWPSKNINEVTIKITNVNDKISSFIQNIMNVTNPTTFFDIAKEIEFEMFICPVCEGICTCRSATERHISEYHGDEFRPDEQYFCKKCVRSFEHEAALRQHESYHTRILFMLRNADITQHTPQPILSFKELMSSSENYQSSSSREVPTVPVIVEDLTECDNYKRTDLYPICSKQEENVSVEICDLPKVETHTDFI